MTTKTRESQASKYGVISVTWRYISKLLFGGLFQLSW